MEGLSLLRRDEMSSSAGGKNTHCHFPPSLPISPFSFKRCLLPLLLLLCVLVTPHYSDKSKFFFSLTPIYCSLCFVFLAHISVSFLFSFFLFLFLFCCSTISHSLSHCLSFSLCSLSLSSFLSQCHKSLISRRRLLLLFSPFEGQCKKWNQPKSADSHNHINDDDSNSNDDSNDSNDNSNNGNNDNSNNKGSNKDGGTSTKTPLLSFFPSEKVSINFLKM